MMSDHNEKTDDFLDPNVWTPEMEMAEIGGGVPGAAGLSDDRARGHERATTSLACFGRGRWELLIDARARRRHR